MYKAVRRLLVIVLALAIFEPTSLFAQSYDYLDPIQNNKFDGEWEGNWDPESSSCHESF